MSQQKPRRIGMGMKPRSPEESGSVEEREFARYRRAGNSVIASPK